jgi:hypothetical protein
MRSGETLDPSAEIEGHQPRRWGMGDAAAGLLLANICAVLGGSLILAATGNQSTDYEDLPLTMVAVLQVPLWLGYLGAPLWAARTKGNGIVADFGFRTRWMDAPIGLRSASPGVAVITLIPIFWRPATRRARTGQDSDVPPTWWAWCCWWRSSYGAPIIEEFLPWPTPPQCREAIRDGWALAATSLLFSDTPPVAQFPARQQQDRCSGF